MTTASAKPIPNLGGKTPQDSRVRNTTTTRLFFYAMFAFIAYGWINHENFYLTAESGAGYYLGIAGGTCMLVLLLYPLRKKLKVFKHFGNVKHWFKLHMALGIIGPTLILYHANFSLGSVNSTVALICMIIVALSGLIGRFIYTHIHYNLYGNKMTLAGLRQSLEKSHEIINERIKSLPVVQDELDKLVETATKRRNFAIQILWLPVMNVNIYFRRKKIKRIMKAEIRKNKSQLNNEYKNAIRDSIRTINGYIETTKRLGQLMTYERLFSLWHILHLPLFFMLVITGIIHVYAVHMY